MKKYLYSIFICSVFIFICACSSSTKALQQGNVHIITLTVETNKISSSNIPQTCNFGQDKKIPNRDFTTEVEVGDYIVWQGKPKDSGRKNDTVIITSIIHQAGPNFFPQDTLEGDNQGRVPGYIDSGKEQEVSKYSLQFEVIKNGVKINEPFVIDPKIRIKKR